MPHVHRSRSPQDINLLNGARENLETIIDTICYEYNEPNPRIYRQNVRKDYLTLAKKKKRTKKGICEALKKQLQYVRRDIGYVDRFLAEGKELCPEHAARLNMIRKVYEQQDYMHRNKKHKVVDRIVSIS